MASWFETAQGRLPRRESLGPFHPGRANSLSPSQKNYNSLPPLSQGENFLHNPEGTVETASFNQGVADGEVVWS